MANAFVDYGIAQRDGSLQNALQRQREAARAVRARGTPAMAQLQALQRTMQHGGFGGPPAPYTASPKPEAGDVMLEATGSPLAAAIAYSLQPQNILRGLSDLGQAAGDYAVRQGSGFGLPPELTGALATGAELVADPTNLIPGGKPAAAGLGALAGLGAGVRRLGSFDMPVDMPVGAQVPGRDISTRLPGTMNPMADASAGDLVIDPDEYVNLPGVKERLAEVLVNYPGMSDRGLNPQGVVDEYRDFRTENLLDVYDRIPPELRDRMQNWYPGAHRIAADRAEKFNLPIEGVAGTYAALSPQKDWFQNVSLGDRVLDITQNPANWGWAPEMGPTLARLAEKSPLGATLVPTLTGKSFDELTDPVEKAFWLRARDEALNTSDYRTVSPEGDLLDVATTGKGAPAKRAWGSLNEISKAVRMLENPGDLQNISELLGEMHKVRNFGMNIINPWSPRGEGTIDTHAIAAGEFSPIGGNAPQVLQNFGSGVAKSKAGFEPWMSSAGLSKPAYGYKGTYPLHLGILQGAGAERGVLPRAMQSITWEGIRNIFEGKSPAVQARAKAVWDEVAAGTKTRQQARDELFDMAGGLTTPAWAQ